MATLLLELFSEEIPSRMQRGAAEQLERLILDGFKKNMLQPTGVKTFVSPRHLAIACAGLPTIQPDVTEERRGPKIGAPEQALKGFLQSTGLTLEQCEQRDGYYYATIERKGRDVAEVVKEVCEAALSAFGWPKSMRWGARPLQWVRPLHNIVCLLDDNIVPVQFAHLTAGNITFGHRFLAPDAITITNAESYEQQLLAAKVMVDFAARKEKIREGVAAIAAQHTLSVIDDEELLNEVTGLVEWPVPLLGTFEEKFLQLPPEVLISEMKTHQRYFALKDKNGKLASQFITVANMVNADGGKKVMEGNSRVVRARLSDGEFYWEQDKKTNLADWGKKLADVVFHAKVGMMDAKVARIEKLALKFAKAVGFTDTAKVQKAAQLCKADLTSGMVGEFPELQGIMGRYYATAQGESADVADAIRDHYKPLGANDSVPEAQLAAIVAIADKLDSIVSLFAAGEKPTGSKDPLALRRAALGILRILIAQNWQIDLLDIVLYSSYLSHLDIKKISDKAALEASWNSYLDVRRKNPEVKVNFDKLLEESDPSKDAFWYFIEKKAGEVVMFLYDRLLQILKDEGLRNDVIEAGNAGSGFNTIAIRNSALSLANWLKNTTGTTALAAIKRSMNILAAEEKKAKITYTFDAAKCAALKLPEEVALVKLVSAGGITTPQQLETFTAPINAFFDAVLVTEEQFRDARLSLLAGVRDAANHIADFSKIEG